MSNYDKHQHSLTINNSQLTINDNPFKYSGYYQDSESGLYYLKARYYSPELMRFINRDTYDLSNRYTYGGGNPISTTDVTGHMPGIIRDLLGFVPGYVLYCGVKAHNNSEIIVGAIFAALTMIVAVRSVYNLTKAVEIEEIETPRAKSARETREAIEKENPRIRRSRKIREDMFRTTKAAKVKATKRMTEDLERLKRDPFYLQRKFEERSKEVNFGYRLSSAERIAEQGKRDAERRLVVQRKNYWRPLRFLDPY
jgi:RHS repeat-associated protein